MKRFLFFTTILALLLFGSVRTAPGQAAPNQPPQPPKGAIFRPLSSSPVVASGRGDQGRASRTRRRPPSWSAA